MIELRDKLTNEPLGTISDKELRLLILLKRILRSEEGVEVRWVRT